MAEAKSVIGLVGLATMGQNLALNIAEKGFKISVWNRSSSKVDDTVQRAKDEGNLPLVGYHDMREFVQSIAKPRKIIILIKAGAPVDEQIEHLTPLLDAGDLLIDGGNEWYENTVRRAKAVESKGLLYMGMGVSGGEEGARHGPSLMPGGHREAYGLIEPIVTKIAAQVDDGPCVTYIGPGGAGNYVKMVHNGIEYGDMQLIAEAYDVLKTVGGLSNEELANVFTQWNQGELQSFLIEITATIFKKKDDKGGEGYLLDKVLDKAGSKGTGMWTVQEAATRGVAVPTIAAALDSRYISTFKDARTHASQVFKNVATGSAVSKEELIENVRKALYAAKICSYAQGMSMLREVSEREQWNLDLGAISRIWKGGCIIRAVFLDRIKQAYDRNQALHSLLVDPEFARELIERNPAWRQVVSVAVAHGIPTPALSASLNFFDSFRRDRLPLNLTQAQRDFFGAHTYERVDQSGVFHSEWAHNQ
eukprot:GILK01001240.1.p1 GENE.GILK01001240.1~~GILK01001240.1.p1  ORF type:complete len:493 (+),score=93.86 GILK01001240.1:49-1479(+)